MTLRRRAPLAACLIPLLAALPALAAPDAAVRAPVPDAGAPAAGGGRSPDAILDDFVKGMGGPRALKRHKSLYMKRKLTSKKMGIEGSEERWATADGRLLSVTTLPGIGEIRTGSTGKQRWSQDPINGLRIVDGTEAEQARLDSTWNGELQLKQLYPQRKLVPTPAPASAAGSPGAGKELDCLEMTPVKVAPVIMCFDRTSHLRVYQQGRQSSPQGEVPYSVHFSDWRVVSGVKIPYLEEMTAGPMTIESRAEEVKLGQRAPGGLFRMPRPGDPAAPDPAKAKAKGR